MALSTADKQHRYRERLKAGRRPVRKGQNNRGNGAAHRLWAPYG